MNSLRPTIALLLSSVAACSAEESPKGTPPVCSSGQTATCGTDEGVCEKGVQTCVDGAWGTCVGGVQPVAELCDGFDNDCDGVVDEDLGSTLTANQNGPCAGNNQTCVEGVNAPNPSNYAPISEICDDVDNDCSGIVDNGCDDDNDDHCDQTITVVGSPATCTSSPPGQGDDCADNDALTFVGAAEVCDGNDNNCDNNTPLDEIDNDNDTYVECANFYDPQGDNIGIAGGGDCNDGDALIHPNAQELCDNVDQNCSAGVDDGCDNDNDDYCDSLMTVVGSPAVCPNSAPGAGDDCNDTNAALFPGATELCVDNVDNNCDGLIDLQDDVACPPLNTLITVPADDLVDVPHDDAVLLTGNVSVANAENTYVWSVLDAVGPGTCDVSDVTLQGQGDDIDLSKITARLIGSDAAIDCVYTVQIAVNGYGTDTIRLRMVSRLPTAKFARAFFRYGSWHVKVPANIPFSITAMAEDVDFQNNVYEGGTDVPIVFNWTGPDIGLFGCAGGCASSDSTFPFTATISHPSGLVPGLYSVSVAAGDAFVRASGLGDLTIEVENCLWAKSGACATDPCDYSSPQHAGPFVQDALDQAAALGDADVCVLGNSLHYEVLHLPVGTGVPDLLGGFDNPTGALNDNLRPTIIGGLGDPSHSFDLGYYGVLHHVNLTHIAPDLSVVDVTNASPIFADVIVEMSGGQDAMAIDIHASSGDIASPEILDSSVYYDPGGIEATDATAIRLVSDGSVCSVDLQRSEVILKGCTGGCTAIYVTANTSASVHGCSEISAYSEDGEARAIFVEGGVTNNASAWIDGNDLIFAETATGTSAIAIQLKKSQDVVISNNRQIGKNDSGAGTQLAVAIADGAVNRTGAKKIGASANLFIVNNQRIVGGGLSTSGVVCAGGGAGPEGPDVAAGILLVGTKGSKIYDNGQPGKLEQGIFGGVSHVAWDPATRLVAPSAMGVWLLDTKGSELRGNEIRAGSYLNFPGCSSANSPVAVAVRDGIPPNVLFGTNQGSDESIDLFISRNGLSCIQTNLSQGTPFLTPCAVVEMNHPNITEEIILTNNVVAATFGSELIALRVNGGGGVFAYHNTFDADLVVDLSTYSSIADGSISKYAVQLLGIEALGAEFANNIFFIHADGSKDGEKWGLYENVDPADPKSNMAEFSNNLLYSGGDDLTDTTSPNYVVISGTSDAFFAADNINEIDGISAIAGNMVALPGLTEVNQGYLKSTMRLEKTSVAIDAGKILSSPVTVDIDGQVRDAAPDIGHDEQ